jgi:hypothetical protein
MALIRPNPTGIRTIIPKSIRDYFSRETKRDNLNFGQRELDETLLNIYHDIKVSAHDSISKDIVIDNVSIHADAYLYALRTIFRSAKSSLKIFAQRLDQRMLDGTPIFTDPEIIDAAIRFLTNSKSVLEILLRERPDPNDLFKGNVLISDITGRKNFGMYHSENRVVRDCGCTFIGVDDSIYNIRYRNYAIINFNNLQYSVSKLCNNKLQ